MKFKLFILTISFLALVGVFFYQSARFFDGKLHVVFCDVGQGDAIFIHTPSGADILVDGGPNEKVIGCLERHMPFWDRKLELVILSHPHDDHYEGLISVFEHYRVDTLAEEELKNKAQSFQKLEQVIKEKNIPVKIVFKGDSFKINDGVSVGILAPTKEFIKETSPGGFIGEREEFASIIPLFTYQDFKLLLTGDTQARELFDAIRNNLITNVTVLQVPHHGSKTGLSQEIIDALKPHLAVISVGAKNRYHHPHPSTIHLLESNHIRYKTTARDGEVEIVTDGSKTRVLR